MFSRPLDNLHSDYIAQNGCTPDGINSVRNLGAVTDVDAHTRDDGASFIDESISVYQGGGA